MFTDYSLMNYKDAKTQRDTKPEYLFGQPSIHMLYLFVTLCAFVS